MVQRVQLRGPAIAIIGSVSPAFFVLAGLSVVAVSRQTVNAIEKGKFDPSLPLAFRAARLFGMPIEEIFLDEAVQLDEGR